MPRHKRPRIPRDGRPAAPAGDGLPPVLNLPDALTARPLTLIELPSGAEELAKMGLPPPGFLRRYMLGDCSVIVTRTPEHGWHLSIAHLRRDPTWDEIGQARYRLLPHGIWTALYLPPPSEYVNIHRFCFQLQECPRPEGY